MEIFRVDFRFNFVISLCCFNESGFAVKLCKGRLKTLIAMKFCPCKLVEQIRLAWWNWWAYEENSEKSKFHFNQNFGWQTFHTKLIQPSAQVSWLSVFYNQTIASSSWELIVIVFVSRLQMFHRKPQRSGIRQKLFVYAGYERDFVNE